MRRFIILSLLSFLVSIPCQGSPSCHALLLSRAEQNAAFTREFEAAVQSSPALGRVYLRLKGRVWLTRLLKDCEKTGGCTGEQIARSVRENVAKQPSLSNALGYGILLGGILANAAVAAGITVWVLPQSEFTPILLGMTLGHLNLLTNTMLSPLSEPVLSKIRRFSFSFSALRNESPKESTSHLETTANTIHATYTLREQYATDRIFQLRNALKLNFQSAAASMTHNEVETAVAEIADAAINAYVYFKDIDPAEPAIRNAVRASFLVKFQDVDSLREPVLEFIKTQTENYDPVAEEYFRGVLEVWLPNRSM